MEINSKAVHDSDIIGIEATKTDDDTMFIFDLSHLANNWKIAIYEKEMKELIRLSAEA